MCGIVGYVGPRQARPLLLAGLEKLEYRGYDSAGISVLNGDRIDTVRAVGNLTRAPRGDGGQRSRGRGRPKSPHPRSLWPTLPEPGIGHTRWATHGRVTEENAHPHFDTADRIHIVVNGIVENYVELKERLAAEGAHFTSETDAEVIAHLVAHHYEGDLVEAVRAAYLELRGHYAFVAMSADEPGVLVGVRKECPLIVGRGEGEQFIASAIPAFLRETRQVQYIEDDELAILRPEGTRVSQRRRHRAGARDRRGRLGCRNGREAGLRDVHAQGDPRAGRRGGGDDRRASGARGGHRSGRSGKHRRLGSCARCAGSSSWPAGPRTTRG